ncbi:t-SNARE domain-containing protein 1-like [Calliphora vicina]|uniref:t-SNARE domain-containing protein 1-like n=1 Tax=Calliphora vicina TaxID=7373 RepID=UPI00325ACA75
MDNKCLKKSTMQQLQTLVRHMEENPEFAKGSPVFGASKRSADEEWKSLCEKLNSLGPPTRTLAEWKKTWADLKSRTKKKLGDNKKSLLETGGGLYRHSHLTELEQIIDRTLFLSSAVPSGPVYGGSTAKSVPQDNQTSIEDCFQSLVETPPRNSKAVAVITPSRVEERQPSAEKQMPHRQQLLQTQEQLKQVYRSDSENEQAGCSSAKKRKRTVDEQIALIRRQLRVAERSAATVKEQVDAAKRLADAAEAQAEAAKRSADAAEATAASMKAIVETTKRIENVLQNYLLNTKK